MGFKLPESVVPIAWALIIGGIWMIVAEQIAARRPASSKVTWPVAIIVGLAQIVAGVFPRHIAFRRRHIFAAMLFGTGNRAAAQPSSPSSSASRPCMPPAAMSC